MILINNPKPFKTNFIVKFITPSERINSNSVIFSLKLSRRALLVVCRYIAHIFIVPRNAEYWLEKQGFGSGYAF